MASVAELFALALEHHQAGRLQAAERLYRQILQVDSNQADVLHLLGFIAYQVGKLEAAVEYISQAIRLDGKRSNFHHNLGDAYRALGRLSDAVACYQRALQLQPDLLDTHHNLGLAWHRLGELDRAIACYRRVLQLQPNDAQTHTNLGHIFRDQRRPEQAIACYQRALELNPENAEARKNLQSILTENDAGSTVGGSPHAPGPSSNAADEFNRLGIVLAQQGKLNAAVVNFQQALQHNPNLAEAHNNLGIALQDLGRLEEAIRSYRCAVELKPDYAHAYGNLGTAFKEHHQLDAAIACFRQALQVTPNSAQMHSDLGVALQDQGKLDEAARCFQQALELKPDFPEAHHNLGNAWRDLGRLSEAIACFQRALQLKPDFAEAYSSLGLAWKNQGNHQEAVACYREALQRKPDYAEAHSNLGNVLLRQGKLDEAVACYRRALERKPDCAEAHLNQSLLSLLTGDFGRGWVEYEWRTSVKPFSPRPFQQPIWDGSRLKGRTILLHAEQGLGDTLQFIRYAPLVQERGAKVLVECQKPLLRLLATCPGIDQLVGQGDTLPVFDLHVPLLSLPRIFQTSLENLPCRGPYLFAAPNLTQQWHCELGPLPGFKIGIVWQGSALHPNDRFRSIPLSYFESLALLQGVRIFSLQKGTEGEDLATLADRFPIAELGSRLDDFMDTAAVLMNLDLVIACDTALVHLAGALGVPVWVALPFVPDWRWLMDRADSPWYPTMRLFRQKKRGDWAGVFEEIRAALCVQLRSGD